MPRATENPPQPTHDQHERSVPSNRHSPFDRPASNGSTTMQPSRTAVPAGKPDPSSTPEPCTTTNAAISTGIACLTDQQSAEPHPSRWLRGTAITLPKADCRTSRETDTHSTPEPCTTGTRPIRPLGASSQRAPAGRHPHPADAPAPSRSQGETKPGPAIPDHPVTHVSCHRGCRTGTPGFDGQGAAAWVEPNGGGNLWDVPGCRHGTMTPSPGRPRRTVVEPEDD